jgi:hypothetical protein
MHSHIQGGQAFLSSSIERRGAWYTGEAGDIFRFRLVQAAGNRCARLAIACALLSRLSQFCFLSFMPVLFESVASFLMRDVYLVKE